LPVVIILFVCLWQIHTQTTNSQTNFTETNYQWTKCILRGEHEKDVEGVAFNPNGKWLASVSDDKNVILWEVNEK